MTQRTNFQWVNDLQQNGATRLQAIHDLREFIERGLYVYLGSSSPDWAGHSNAQLRQMARKFAEESLRKVLDNLHMFRGASRFTTWAAKFAARAAITAGLQRSQPIRAESELPNPLLNVVSATMLVERSEN